MVTKQENYRLQLKTLDDWEPFLLQESGLPGPRGNLELAAAVADEGTPALFERLLAENLDPTVAPTDSPREFLAFCGVLGLGQMLTEGRLEIFDRLSVLSADPRWRIREAVAMALQRLGDVDMPRLLDEMERWAGGTPWEQRAAMAALCEPRLLTKPNSVSRVLQILDRITRTLEQALDRNAEGFRVLRQGLGYGWSVVVAADPAQGKPEMERWLASPDRDVRWIMKENLKKKRLERMDEVWVNAALNRLK